MAINFQGVKFLCWRDERYVFKQKKSSFCSKPDIPCPCIGKCTFSRVYSLMLGWGLWAKSNGSKKPPPTPGNSVCDIPWPGSIIAFTSWSYSYHIWTNVSVKMGIIWGISVHSIHVWGRGINFSLVCTIEKTIKNAKVNVDVQRGPYCLCLFVSSNSSFHPLLSYMVIVLNDYLVHPCWGLHVGSRFLQTGGSCSAHELLWDLLSWFWEKYHALNYVCSMQSLSYMLWMKKKSMTFHKKLEVEFICNKCLPNLAFIFHVCRGFIY